MTYEVELHPVSKPGDSVVAPDGDPALVLRVERRMITILDTAPTCPKCAGRRGLALARLHWTGNSWTCPRCKPYGNGAPDATAP